MKEKDLPKRQNYDRFFGEFTEAVGKMHPEACVYAYGSYVSGDFVPWVSDIDGGIILDANFVTPKKTVMDLAAILSRCLSRNRIGLHFNLTDRESNKDGRFMSYTYEYTDWMKKKPIIVCGGCKDGEEDYMHEMNGLKSKSPQLQAAAMNLRSVRNRLLFSLNDLGQDKERFQNDFISSIKKAAKFPKKIIEIAEGEIVTNKPESLKRMSSMLPEVNTETLQRINNLLKNPQALFRFVYEGKNEENILQLYQKAVTSMEEIARSYSRRF